MSKAPAFQFYANDFMDATSMWEANAVGLYVRCLCKQWTHGSIPADLRILARAIHCDRSELESCWEVLGPKFIDQGDGTLKNSRLEEVRTRQEEVSAKRSEAGKAGAIAKANAKANGQAKTQQRKVKEKEKVEVEREVEGEGKENTVTFHEAVLWPSFADFWNAYDKKRNPALCQTLWARLSQQEKEAAVRGAEEYVKAQPDKQYRKDPERWLRGRCWQDEIITAKPVTNGQSAKGPYIDPNEAARRTEEYFARKRASGGVDTH